MIGALCHDGDHEVLRALLAWSAAGEKGALVTVLRTWGSSPRPPGSLLAIRHGDGRMVGSVSGGCVEVDLVERYMRDQIAGFPCLIDYGADPAGAARFGLPCGGQLELLVEQPPGPEIAGILEAIADGQLVERRVCLKRRTVSLERGATHGDFRVDGETVCKPFGPRWHLVMVGAGPIADCLAPIASTLGFHVTLCDPRSEFDSGLDGLKVQRRMPDDLVAGLTNRQRTAVLTLAHDPKIDDLALLEALNGEFLYVGALGSRRSAQTRRERLASLGIDARQLSELRAPVGLRIGSRTPAEIAVAIAAELTAVCRGVETMT